MNVYIFRMFPEVAQPNQDIFSNLPEMEMQALASGQALDGAEGSLCVLNSGGQLPPGAKSPFIPASAGGGGCNLGLTCLTLGVSAPTPSMYPA